MLSACCTHRCWLTYEEYNNLPGWQWCKCDWRCLTLNGKLTFFISLFAQTQIHILAYFMHFLNSKVNFIHLFLSCMLFWYCSIRTSRLTLNYSCLMLCTNSTHCTSAQRTSGHAESHANCRNAIWFTTIFNWRYVYCRGDFWWMFNLSCTSSCC